MTKNKWIIIFLFTLFMYPSISNAETKGLIADFNSGQYVNHLGHEIEVWLKGDGNDETQSCSMEFSDDDALGDTEGQSLRILYDVDSPNPAYNGVRTDLGFYDASDFTHLNFYVKGDSEKGFSDKVKIELIGKSGRPSPYIVQGVTEEWKKIQVPLTDFFAVRDWTQLQKFVVVFADITNDPKDGVLYLDQIYFSKE